MVPGRRRVVVPSGDGGGPSCPPELFYLWRYFIELSQGIGSGGFGPAVVTWADLRAWRFQMGIELAPWEARALVMLGSLRASIASEQTAKTAPGA